MQSNCGVGEDSWDSLGLARRSYQTILKEINPEYSLEGLMLKLTLQYFGLLMGKTDSLEKTLMLGETEGRRRRGQQRMRWLGWHHWLDGHEFEHAADGQGSLACCGPWGRKESDTTGRLNWLTVCTLNANSSINCNPTETSLFSCHFAQMLKADPCSP